MVRRIALAPTAIVSGTPLPFSIFDPNHNRLLATKGQLVTERLRASLLRTGLMAFTDDDERPLSSQETVKTHVETIQPLLQLRLQYASASVVSRSGFRISRQNGSVSHMCRVIGISARRGLILSAPIQDDGSHVAIQEGETWLFRTLYATAAIRFAGVINKVVLEPFPYFHVEVPPLIEMRHIRKVQRVAICINAVLRSSSPAEAAIVDLSTTGMQIAVEAHVGLQESHRFKVDFRIVVLGKAYDLSVDAVVMRTLGATDPRHPHICFYGLGIETHTEFDRMVLHAFVQGCVIDELDSLSKVLAE